MELDTLSISIPVPQFKGTSASELPRTRRRFSRYRSSAFLAMIRARRIGNCCLLPSETYEKIQRATNKDRREGVAGYIEQRFGVRPSVGAFPAISIGITRATRFELLPGQSAIGNLHLEQEGECIVLDGLGRISGCLDLADEGSEGTELVKRIVMPVTFYVPFPGSDPLTIGELGQLFMDFNFRVHPVPVRIAIALDQSDVYIAFANALAKEPFIAAHGGMEFKAASRGKKSTAIVVQAILLRAIRGACEGRDFQESNQASTSNPNLTDETFRQEMDSVARFFSEIALRMRERWNNPQAILDFLRKRTGLQSKLDAVKSAAA